MMTRRWCAHDGPLISHHQYKMVIHNIDLGLFRTVSLHADCEPTALLWREGCLIQQQPDYGIARFQMKADSHNLKRIGSLSGGLA